MTQIRTSKKTLSSPSPLTSTMHQLNRTTHHSNTPYPHIVTSYHRFLKPPYPPATPHSYILTSISTAPSLTGTKKPPSRPFSFDVVHVTETPKDASGSIHKPTYRPNKWVRRSTHLYPSTPTAPVLSANPAHHPLLVPMRCHLTTHHRSATLLIVTELKNFLSSFSSLTPPPSPPSTLHFQPETLILIRRFSVKVVCHWW